MAVEMIQPVFFLCGLLPFYLDINSAGVEKNSLHDSCIFLQSLGMK